MGLAAGGVHARLKLLKRVSAPIADRYSGGRLTMSSLLTSPTASTRASWLLFAPIAADLAAVERVYDHTLENAKPGLARLIQHLDQYRGKRLRPVLLLLTAHACGRVTPAHHVLGAVVEMIHTATLVHDDVLDSATVRRHVATVNANWGNQCSILLGDMLFTHAFHLASTLGDARACEMIGEATNHVCEGELQQVRERGNLALSEDEYFSIIDGKTAELTSCCCRLGALHLVCQSQSQHRQRRRHRPGNHSLLLDALPLWSGLVD